MRRRVDVSVRPVGRVDACTPRLVDLPPLDNADCFDSSLGRKGLFRLTKEEHDRVLVPMILSGKEQIGSMGNTARPAIFSSQPLSFFDFFYQCRDFVIMLKIKYYILCF